MVTAIDHIVPTIKGNHPRIKRRLMVAGGVGTLIATMLLGSEGANASTGATSTDSTFTSQSCVAQVKAIAAVKHVSAASAGTLCSATVTTTESPAQVASVADVKSSAAEQKLSPSQTQNLVSAAAAGAIQYRDWTHTYWGGSVVEVHTGRTFWDGSKAWISSYRGYAGSHTCHAAGSWAVGWTVTPISCSHPGAASSANAYYRFDESALFKGSPVTLGVGLTYSTTASGASSGSVTGG